MARMDAQANARKHLNYILKNGSVVVVGRVIRYLEKISELVSSLSSKSQTRDRRSR